MKIKKAYEQVAEAIQAQIDSGAFQPGSKLNSVEQLATDYGVGRSTIREALMSLRAKGYLNIRQGGGTFVLQPEKKSTWQPIEVQSATQLKDWLETRFILETEIAALAAERRTTEHLQSMQASLTEMTKTNDEDVLEKLDIQFHLLIGKASGNKLLTDALDTLLAAMGSHMRDSRKLWIANEQTETGAQHLHADHTRIYEAIEQQNGKLSKARMAAHLKKVNEVLKDALA